MKSIKIIAIKIHSGIKLICDILCVLEIGLYLLSVAQLLKKIIRFYFKTNYGLKLHTTYRYSKFILIQKFYFRYDTKKKS